MAVIHPTRRTPQSAVIVTGVILLAMAFTLPIETVGSAASLMFLLTFSMVNLSVIALRRKYPNIERRYRVPLYPIVPLLGFALNIFLAIYQFNFQPIAWFVTVGWVALGLLLYYAVFEKKAAPFEPQVLLPRKGAEEPSSQPCVLVALHNPDNVHALLSVAVPVAKQRGVRTVAITVVEVPRQMPVHYGMRVVHHRESLFNETRRYARDHGLEIDTDVVIAHHAADGILTAVERHRANALVMGWKGFTNARDRIFGEVADRVIRHAPCDIMMMKIGEQKEFNTCLLPTAGGPNAKLAASVINALKQDHEFQVTTANVIPPGADEQVRQEASERIDATMAKFSSDGKDPVRLIESGSIAGGIAKASREYDLVVIGAAIEPLFRTMLFGEIPEKVARYSKSSVLVVKKYEGVVKSVWKRVMG